MGNATNTVSAMQKGIFSTEVSEAYILRRKIY
jgi:hypothetical protein